MCIRDRIITHALPFENKYLSRNPSALNAIIKTIQKLSNRLKERMDIAILNLAFRYWKDNGENYKTTKTFITTHYGGQVWENIKSVFTRKTQLALGITPMPVELKNPKVSVTDYLAPDDKTEPEPETESEV